MDFSSFMKMIFLLLFLFVVFHFMRKDWPQPLFSWCSVHLSFTLTVNSMSSLQFSHIVHHFQAHTCMRSISYHLTYLVASHISSLIRLPQNAICRKIREKSKFLKHSAFAGFYVCNLFYFEEESKCSIFYCEQLSCAFCILCCCWCQMICPIFQHTAGIRIRIDQGVCQCQSHVCVDFPVNMNKSIFIFRFERLIICIEFEH